MSSAAGGPQEHAACTSSTAARATRPGALRWRPGSGRRRAATRLRSSVPDGCRPGTGSRCVRPCPRRGRIPRRRRVVRPATCRPWDGTGHGDVAFGRRPGRLIEDGARPWHARLGNDLVAAIMSIRAGRRVHDMPPFKALRAPILARLELSDAGYGWTTQLVARVIAEPTIRFRELPVRFRRRQGGTSKVSGSWRASVAAGRAMVGRAWSETSARPLLGLMAKAPGAGRAKTRLAASSAMRPRRHSGQPAWPMPPTARSERREPQGWPRSPCSRRWPTSMRSSGSSVRPGRRSSRRVGDRAGTR